MNEESEAQKCSNEVSLINDGTTIVVIGDTIIHINARTASITIGIAKVLNKTVSVNLFRFIFLEESIKILRKRLND